MIIIMIQNHISRTDHVSVFSNGLDRLNALADRMHFFVQVSAELVPLCTAVPSRQQMQQD